MVDLSLAALADDDALFIEFDPGPTWAELFELRRHLQLGMAELTADRGEAAPLRLTKGRVRTMAICPAQVLGEVQPFGINFNIAVGIVCDAAAGILALHPAFEPGHRGATGWFDSLRPSLQQEHPHLVDFADGLGAGDRADFEHVTDDLCGTLSDLVGDLRPYRPTVHHRLAYVPAPGVQITGEVDISCDVAPGDQPAGGRILAEVKSGRFNPRIADELAHYGLITALQRLPADESEVGITAGRPPLVVGCSVSLGDLAVTPIQLGIEVLETSVRRLLDTAKGLLAIDETMRSGGRPTTNPGDHCRWCRRVNECGDAPDLVMAELNQSLRPLEGDGERSRFDPDFDDGPVDEGFDETTVEETASGAS